MIPCVESAQAHGVGISSILGRVVLEGVEASIDASHSGRASLYGHFTASTASAAAAVKGPGRRNDSAEVVLAELLAECTRSQDVRRPQAQESKGRGVVRATKRDRG